MSVLSFDADALFVFRIVKHLETNPDRQWANSYEFQAGFDGTESALLTLGETLVEFEQLMHHAAVVFDRLLISTWAPDSKPYNPDAFISSTLTAAGTLPTTTSEVEPLNMCLSVTRQCRSGRFGHIFYRANLTEEDVVSPAGSPTLGNRPAKQASLDDAISASGLDAYINSPMGGALNMVLVGKTASDVRIVTGLRVQGVSVLPLDHAWFNRTSP